MAQIILLWGGGGGGLLIMCRAGFKYLYINSHSTRRQLTINWPERLVEPFQINFAEGMLSWRPELDSRFVKLVIPQMGQPSPRKNVNYTLQFWWPLSSLFFESMCWNNESFTLAWVIARTPQWATCPMDVLFWIHCMLQNLLRFMSIKIQYEVEICRLSK